MQNIEKVIKGLEWCSRADKVGQCVYALVDCPYTNDCQHDKRDQLKLDAIELLKQYQAAKPMIDDISEQMHDAATMFRMNHVDSIVERLKADKNIAYKMLQVLEWLSEVAKEPETFTHELYSDSEISNLAANALAWINELAENNDEAFQRKLFDMQVELQELKDANTGLKLLIEELHKERNIVFCKDCRYRDTESCLVNYVSSREDYWFCADGERKENN